MISYRHVDQMIVQEAKILLVHKVQTSGRETHENSRNVFWLSLQHHEHMHHQVHEQLTYCSESAENLR